MPWTYKPLVQDVLGMSLNRVTLDAEPSAGQQLLQPGAPSVKTYEVGVITPWVLDSQPMAAPIIAGITPEDRVREGCALSCSEAQCGMHTCVDL